MVSRWSWVGILVVGLGASGCRGVAQYTSVGGPITSSAVSKLSGGCYSQCSAGHVCNATTGLCEPVSSTNP